MLKELLNITEDAGSNKRQLKSVEHTDEILAGFSCLVLTTSRKCGYDRSQMKHTTQISSATRKREKNSEQLRLVGATAQRDGWQRQNEESKACDDIMLGHLVLCQTIKTTLTQKTNTGTRQVSLCPATGVI